MAEVRQELKEKKKKKRQTSARTIPSSKTLEPGVKSQGAESARKRKQAPGKRAKAGSTANGKTKEKEAAGEDGAERLNQAADRLVKRNCGELSRTLLEKAKSGNMASFRLLVMLAGRKKPREKPVKKPCGPSLAMRWAAEPEWKEGDTGSEGTSELV